MLVPSPTPAATADRRPSRASPSAAGAWVGDRFSAFSSIQEGGTMMKRNHVIFALFALFFILFLAVRKACLGEPSILYYIPERNLYINLTRDSNKDFYVSFYSDSLSFYESCSDLSSDYFKISRLDAPYTSFGLIDENCPDTIYCTTKDYHYETIPIKRVYAGGRDSPLIRNNGDFEPDSGVFCFYLRYTKIKGFFLDYQNGEGNHWKLIEMKE